ncbi:dTDP-4-dehydrorhamnose reductase [Arcticibacter tournemirensis]
MNDINYTSLSASEVNIPPADLGTRIIVFGASGQLGQCLQQQAAVRGIKNINFLPEENADILDKDIVAKVFADETPAYVINCAAYTAVDRAEDEIDTARKVNRDGVANLATVCRAHQSTLIHISTDFVFEGDVPKLLGETEPARPINIYGLTKLQGEAALAGIIHKYYILRTSWLYSEYGNNFVKTMLKLGRERDELGVIVDQVGTPTYGMDLASAIFDIIQSDVQAYGIYHYSNEGVASWYDFAKAIFDLSGTTVKLKPVKTSEYVTKAARPAFSVMDKSKIKDTFGLEIPYWRDSLSDCIGKLQDPDADAAEKLDS